MEIVASYPGISGLTIRAPHNPSYDHILTTDALAFLVQLHRLWLIESEMQALPIGQGTPDS